MDKKGFYVVSPFIGVIFILIVITMAAFIVNENKQQLELSKAGFGDEMIFLGQVLVADAFDVYIQNEIQRILDDGTFDLSGPGNPPGDCPLCIDVRAKAGFDSQVENLYIKTFDVFDLECNATGVNTMVFIPEPVFTVPKEYNPARDGSWSRKFYYIYDGVGDECDSCPDDRFNDIDKDGECADEDNCPYAYNPTQADSDGDTVGDACDPSSPALDNDDVINFLDNCPEIDNLDQADSDYDAIGDACDQCPGDRYNDLDGDGRCENGDDNCPGVFPEYDLFTNPNLHISHYNPNQEDCDNNDGGNACDPSPGPDCFVTEVLDPGPPRITRQVELEAEGSKIDDGVHDDINDYFDNCLRNTNEDQVDIDDGECYTELTVVPQNYNLNCESQEAFGEFDITFTGRKYLLVGTTICCDDPEGIVGLPDDSGLVCP